LVCVITAAAFLSKARFRLWCNNLLIVCFGDWVKINKQDISDYQSLVTLSILTRKSKRNKETNKRRN
jgi:hypothetical protein